MSDKKLFELMLEKNMRGELAGNFDSMEMREFLQKVIELFEENEALKAEIDRIHRMISNPEEINRAMIKICGMNLFIRYTDDEKQSVERLGMIEQENERLQREVEGLQEVRHDMAKLNEFMSTEISKPKYVGRPCVDTAIEEIELLKRENDKLHCQDCATQAFEVACLLQDYKEKNERLNLEKELLEMRNAAMAKTLKQWIYAYNGTDLREADLSRAFIETEKVISDMSMIYHNPADKSEYHNPAETEIIITESVDDNDMLDEALAWHNPADVVEIKQLQAQLERVRGIALNIANYVRTFGMSKEEFEKYNELLEKLVAIDRPAVYHNPADVEALAKAREALEMLIKSLESYGSHDNPISPWSLISQVRQALAAIEKAGGGECAEKKAERDMMTLPCKVGDAVKVIAYRPYNGHEATIFGEVAAIIITDKIIIRISYMQCRHIEVLDTDFGKTVFLLPAEASVKAQEEGD